MRPFKAVRFSRNSKSGLIRNIINAGIRPAYEKVRSIFPYDKGDRGRSAEPTCERSLLFLEAALPVGQWGQAVFKITENFR